MRFPDEEPDWDEDPLARVVYEYQACSDLCERCGLGGHRENRCPTVNLLTYPPGRHLP